MKIAIIGTGRVGKTLARLWVSNGHAVKFGSRNEQQATVTLSHPEGAATSDVEAVSIYAAADFCDVALLAVPWYAFTDVERLIGDALDGKVIIDCINPFTSSGSLALGHKRSAGEEIQKRFHRSFVVKAFNHLHYSAFDNPQYGEQAATAFYCSNFDAAKNAVVLLSQEMGFEPVDAGPIKNARLLEPLAALWTQLAYVTHQGVDTAFRLVSR